MSGIARAIQIAILGAAFFLTAKVAGGQLESTQSGDASSHAEQNAGAVSSRGVDDRMPLAGRAVEVALEKAVERLETDRYRDAANMAYAGMDALDALPASVDKQTLRRTFVQLILDARVEQDGGPDAASKWETGGKFHGMLDDARAVLAGIRREHASKMSATDSRRERSDNDARMRRSAAVRRAYKADEADALIRVGEARRIPHRELTYPPDWTTRPNRNAGGKVGVLFEGPAFRDAGGEVQQTVMYDIRSLLLPPFEFNYVPSYDLRSATRNNLDREALRRGSEIFNGYPRDLAQGLPLLNFFGGVGDWPGTVGDSDREYELLLEMIDAVTDQ